MRHDFAIDTEDESLLDEMWTVNSKSPLRLTHAAFEHLKNSGHQRIVNIVSLSGKRVDSAVQLGYGMSKHAAIALTHAARYSGWEYGIRATAICHGNVATDMAAGADLPLEDMIPADVIAELVATALKMPNSASLTEIPVNCYLEHSV